jgi:hypothetical protein
MQGVDVDRLGWRGQEPFGIDHEDAAEKDRDKDHGA